MHDLDLVRHLTGKEYAETAVQVLRRDDSGRIVEAGVDGILEGGAQVSHHVSWVAPTRARTVEWHSPTDSNLIDLAVPNTALAGQRGPRGHSARCSRSCWAPSTSSCDQAQPTGSR